MGHRQCGGTLQTVGSSISSALWSLFRHAGWRTTPVSFGVPRMDVWARGLGPTGTGSRRVGDRVAGGNDRRTRPRRPPVLLPQLKRIRWAVRAALILGVAASVAANVLHARQ